MMVRAFPYRQGNGYRSVLQAVSRDDARRTLHGWGAVFCEVKMDVDALFALYADPDRDAQIDALLAAHENFSA